MTDDKGRKRLRENDAESVDPVQAVEPAPAQVDAAASDGDDDAPLLSNFKMSRTVRKGHECPYLDTISRQVSTASLLAALTRPTAAPLTVLLALLPPESGL